MYKYREINIKNTILVRVFVVYGKMAKYYLNIKILVPAILFLLL